MSINVLSRKLVATESSSNTAGHEFTVLQWNVLADWLCDAKAFPHAHNEECLKWDNRATAFKLILAAGPAPDLVSMQEVDHWDDFFKAEMEKLGLKGHFYKKEAADAADGSVLCWRPEVFDLVEIEKLRLEEQQSQVAIFARLLHKPSQREVLMITTHLKAKPGFEERRALQGVRILNKAKEVAEKCKTSPLVIIAGDFNDTPDSLVAKLFRGHTVVTEKSGSLPNSLGALQSAYASSSSAVSYGDCNDALYTTYKKRETEVCRTIDYIWYTPRSDVAISALMEIPAVNQLEHRLPAEYYPSDHFAIAASFKLK